MSASAAAVVNSFVFDAGVKSLSEFSEYSAWPEGSDMTSTPQNPRAKSGELRTLAMRSCSGFGGAAAAAAPIKSRTAARTGETKRKRAIIEIVAPAKIGQVLE